MKPDQAILATGYRYFLAVAEAGSIRAAAKNLNIVSSAVNRQLLMLEAALGIDLFERVGRGLRLSEAGHVLARELRGVLVGFDTTRAELDALRGLKRGKIRLATVESFSVNRLPALLGRFWHGLPGIEVTVRVAVSDEVTAMVAAGDADIGFAFNPHLGDGLVAVRERAYPIGALVAPGHPLAGRASVRFADLIDHPLALPARGLSLRAAIEPLVSRHARTLRPRIEANALRIMATFAADHGCVAFHTPVGIERELASGSLCLIPLSDPEIPRDRLVVLGSTARTASLAVTAFLAFLTETWDDMV